MSEVTSPYERLDPERVRETVHQLVRRIEARFPRRHLSTVAGELGRALDDVAAQAAQTRHRHRVVRLLSGVLMVVVAVLTVLALGLAVRDATRFANEVEGFLWLSIIESAVNDLVFAALALWFLLTVPSRLDRRRTLTSLHRLRTLAHVVDMHQLTKDPERLHTRFRETGVHVEFDLDEQGLARYLEYCSELLALVAKTAALFAEESTDAVVLDTVSEIETLTLSMSRKIWQKISLLPRT
jgi:hypothetical protein